MLAQLVERHVEAVFAPVRFGHIPPVFTGVFMEKSDDEVWSATAEVKFDSSDRKHYTVFGVAGQIIEMAPELKEHKKHIEAMIKRLIHSEKASVYQRIDHYISKDPVNDWVHKELPEKVKTHLKFAVASDDEVITW